MKRRDFLKNSLSAGLLLAIPLLNSSCEKEDDNGSGTGGLPPGGDLTIDLGSSDYASLNNSGSFLIINSIIIANTGDSFVALSSRCTHQGCTISYSSSNNNFPCGCHGSVFSPTGSVVVGPASVPVKRYNVSRTGDILTITG
jgi:cytochrome b6-f complex iron-sulfur subunit